MPHVLRTSSRFAQHQKEPPDLRGSNRRKKVSALRAKTNPFKLKKSIAVVSVTGCAIFKDLLLSFYRQTPKPAPIALEPINGHKAAVLSLLIKLPCGDEDYTPHGQSGLAIGSSLVSLGKFIFTVDLNLCNITCEYTFPLFFATQSFCVCEQYITCCMHLILLL